MKTKFLKIIFLTAAVISVSYADFYVIPIVKKVKNVIIVSKNGGDFKDPILAMKSITDANETNRYIVKISEGVYDLNETMKMKPYVDVIGEGRAKTLLKGEIASDAPIEGTLIMAANNSILSDMSIQNSNAINTTMAISIYCDQTDSFILRNLDINLSSTGDYSWAVYAFASNITIDNSNIVSTGLHDIRALYLQFAYSSVIESNLSAVGGEKTYGIYGVALPFSIQKSNILVYDASVSNSAIHIAREGATVIFNSHIEADYGSDTAIVSDDGYSTIINSEIYGISGLNNICIDCTGAGGLALDKNCTVP